MAVPAAPVLRARNQGNGVIRLWFAAVAGATSYKLYKGDAPDPTVQVGTPSPSPDVTYDEDLLEDMYWYRLKATNADGDSAYSANVKVNTNQAVMTPSDATVSVRIQRTWLNG